MALAWFLFPLLELWLLIAVGSRIGALATVLWVVLSGALGLALLRRQGMALLWANRRRMSLAEPPELELLDALLAALAAFLLVLPGFITDTAGLLLLVPLLRRGVLKSLLARRRWQVVAGAERRAGQEHSDPSRIIEGEFKRERD